MQIKEILEQLKKNQITFEEAEQKIKNNQYEDLGYAKIDHNRKERSGCSEVVFCQGKPDEFLSPIFRTIYEKNGEVLGTRASKEQYELLKNEFTNLEYDAIARILKIEKSKPKYRQYCDLYRWNSGYPSGRRGCANGGIFWKPSRTNL